MVNSNDSVYVQLKNIELGRKALLCRDKIDRPLEKKLLSLGFSNLIPLSVTHKRKGGLVVSVGNARIALNNALASQVTLTYL